MTDTNTNTIDIQRAGHLFQLAQKLMDFLVECGDFMFDLESAKLLDEPITHPQVTSRTLTALELTLSCRDFPEPIIEVMCCLTESAIPCYLVKVTGYDNSWEEEEVASYEDEAGLRIEDAYVSNIPEAASLYLTRQGR